ncbi:DUF1294 domain-containing protein [Brevundimonas sp.]|uniref:DUF1294 domain-containing protein n=1 Tax=Brevundimonas sp. TaxID=1871086 RepID=UPI003F7149AA
MSELSLIDRLLIVLAVLELAAFGLFWFDKVQARNGDWRIRERSLLIMALFGGIGAWFAQHLLRHKTRKEPFRTLLGVAVGVHLVGVAVGVWWVVSA